MRRIAIAWMAILAACGGAPEKADERPASSAAPPESKPIAAAPIAAAPKPRAAKPAPSKPVPLSGETVVIYTALDELYSAPILADFERRTGIKVEAVYDSEAAKTVGLVNRLIAERDRPRCDVFWNNEVVRTVRLKKEGLLAAYASPNAAEVPAAFKDAEGYWTGFAARARVLAFNTKLIQPADAPQNITDLANEKWKGKVGMAYPLFGSTATHAAALFSRWGEDKAKAFFEGLKANDIKILDGNMTVCRAVANGELPLGMTDTDDARLLKGEGKPIDFLLLPHEGDGALLIPNSVALIKDGPNPDGGRKLVDHILSPETEASLAASASGQIPLHPGVEAPPDVTAMAQSRFMKVNFADAERRLEPSADFLKGVFAKP